MARLTGVTRITNHTCLTEVTAHTMIMMKRKNAEYEFSQKYKGFTRPNTRVYVPKDVCYHCRVQLKVGDLVLSKPRSSGKTYYHKECAEFLHII